MTAIVGWVNALRYDHTDGSVAVSVHVHRTLRDALSQLPMFAPVSIERINDDSRRDALEQLIDETLANFGVPMDLVYVGDHDNGPQVVERGDLVGALTALLAPAPS